MEHIAAVDQAMKDFAVAAFTWARDPDDLAAYASLQKHRKRLNKAVKAVPEPIVDRDALCDRPSFKPCTYPDCAC